MEGRLKNLMCEMNTVDSKEIRRYDLLVTEKSGEKLQAAHRCGCEGFNEN
jgi:hypothetical protein